uniref:M13-type metalloendopeptidase n=1 Tax=Spirosoma foliorum TaxID=2710596 RepID=UPI001C70F5E6|nr:M13-type metalloendopeptidase [Spirosoma foliorum]
MQVLTNPHSPVQFRVNGPLSNFDAFYTYLTLSTPCNLTNNIPPRLLQRWFWPVPRWHWRLASP